MKPIIQRIGIAKKAGPYLLTAVVNRLSIPPRKLPGDPFRNGMLNPINVAMIESHYD